MNSSALKRASLLLFLVCATCLPVSAGAQTPPPCKTRPEYRQFDFWVGEWDVTAGGQTVASSTIQRLAGECIIFENYSQPDGFAGKSLNFFDAASGKWRQTWVDAAGNVSEFAGEFRDGAMRYEGESHLRDGRRVLRKMIVYNLSPERVRQYSERSTDGGKTWSVAYDLLYVRKK